MLSLLAGVRQLSQLAKLWAEGRRKGNEEYLYSAILVCRTHKVLRHGSHSFICKLHHACLSFVSIHQMVPPLNSRDPVAAYYSFINPKWWKAELAWLVDL